MQSGLTRSTRMFIGKAYECGFPSYEAPRSPKEALRWYKMVDLNDTEARAAIERLEGEAQEVEAQAGGVAALPPALTHTLKEEW